MTIRTLGLILAASALLLALVFMMVKGLEVSGPRLQTHTASIAACNSAIEMGSIMEDNPQAVAAVRGLSQASGTIIGSGGNQPVSAYVANAHYIVLVGTGASALPCHIPIASKSLGSGYRGTAR